MMKTQLSTIAIFVLTGLNNQAQATLHEGIDTALSNGTLNGLLRYRYEQVDQNGIDKTAHASTLLTRLTYTTAPVGGIKAVFEVDDVTSVGNELYNSTVNGNTQRPVVADPTGTEVNQANLQFNRDAFTFTLGKQRINLDDQRFIGGVAWRQNEQTFDGYRAAYQVNDAFKVDYSYVYNVNRIFSEKSAASDLHGKLHLANTSYKVRPSLALSGFAYLLDFDHAAALSTQTLGIRLSGKLVNDLAFTLSYANQQEHGDNPNDFNADYYLAELKGKWEMLGWTVGYESLGSDNDVGFSTPLATGHKFQGFADKFLKTPANGVADWYVGFNGMVSGIKLAVTYHQFDSVKNHLDYGSEIDFTAAYNVTDKCNVLLKYAQYDAKELATDTDKVWFMVTHKF